MNSAKIQARIYKAYGKAAKALGTTHKFYRPDNLAVNDSSGGFLLDDDGGIVIADGYIVPFGQPAYQSISASFNSEDMKYGKPNKYGHPTWYGVFDGTNVDVGDYVIGAAGTFFVAAMQPMLPILVVECNRTASVLRPQQQTGVGAVGYYGGNTPAAEKLLMKGWPCSILQGTKGEKNEVNLPGDTRAPWWTILMPYSMGVVLRTSDIITCDLKRRYIISSAELTDLGWRISASLAVT
jgi:hypothetical protein